MSGIVGIVHFDGAPVDCSLLGQMTSFMAFRGPDAQEIWIDGNAGFGHTLLKTTLESGHERQPFTLDGRVWIVADARVDARRELIPQLQAHGHTNLTADVTDVELILRSYQTWDENCVEHLLGDFAFAIWDGPQQRLFCARDHLGVKPFFYAHIGRTLIFSNTLDCIRQHPAVSDRLNDLAIADFLLFDMNQDMATTTFADIQRIPPAHLAKWSAGGMQLRRYWTLPIDEPLYFRKADDYVDRFRELLDSAIEDRLRTKKIAVFMSGGLDSPTMAATASRILSARSSGSGVHAFTTLIDGFDSNERHYAGMVAEHLGIPIHFQDLSGKTFNCDWAESTVHTAEPISNPINIVSERRQYQVLVECSRVWFYGEGPDNALRDEWPAYFSHLARRRQFGRLAASFCQLAVRSRHIPFLPRILRPIKMWWRGESEQAEFPRWLNQQFVSRLQLRERWEDRQRPPAPCPHPLRPTAYRSFDGILWEDLFSRFDAAATGVAAEARHPFVDLRLLRYMLAVPAVPWCRQKHLVRRAMKGVLPEPVLCRPKSPLTGDPQWQEALRLGLSPFQPGAGLEPYVDHIRVPAQTDQDMINFWVDFRPRALNYWLRNVPTKKHDFASERLHKEHLAGRHHGQGGPEMLKAVS